MTRIKLPRQQIIFAFAFAFALVTFTSCWTRIQARPAKPVISMVRFVPPPPPIADRGAPSGRLRGGASRGQCPAIAKPLTALVPATKKTLNLKQALSNSALDTFEVVWGLTTAESPTLWFYVPYSLTPKLPLQFVLQDDQDNEVYTGVPLTVFQTSPGIIKFSLPSTVALKIGKMYHWYFEIDCASDAPVFVEGWIQRTALKPALLSQLKQASPRQKVALYAANGIWFDALTTLAELRIANPSDSTLQDDWVSLLDSVDLDAIATEPILQCCTPKRGEQELGERLLP